MYGQKQQHVIKEMKRITTLFFTIAYCHVFGLGFLPGQPGGEMPEGGFKTSTCPWGRSLHYVTDEYHTKPSSTDNVTMRGGQIVEIDQNIYWGSLSLNVPKLVFAKGKKLKFRQGINIEMHPSKLQLENCTVEMNENLSFNYWHKSRWGGMATLELIDTKFDTLGGLICIVPVHPDVTFNDPCGVNFILKGKTHANFGTGAVIDDIFSELPNMWKFKIRFVVTKDGVPSLKFNYLTNAKNVEFYIDIEDTNIKPGTYALMTLEDRNSSFDNSTYFVNGNSYGLGTSFNVGKHKGKVILGPSPTGKDSTGQNDLLLVIER